MVMFGGLWNKTTAYSSTCIRVFISSSRLAQASFTVSLCWAIVAASECPVPINWSQTSLVFASRSFPIFVVSCLKSSNFCINIWNIKRGNVLNSYMNFVLAFMNDV